MMQLQHIKMVFQVARQMTLSILGKLFFARDWLFGVIAASPAPVADLEMMVLPTCLRGTRATHHTMAHYARLCSFQNAPDSSTKLNERGKTQRGWEKKEERDREERSLFGFRLSPPLPLSTTPSVLLQQSPRTPNEITAAKSRVVRAENRGGRGHLSSGVRLPKMSECSAQGCP